MKRTIVGLGWMLTACALASAHHGVTALYDTSRSFTVHATVTQFQFAGPHPQLYFDVKDSRGEVTHWRAEIGPNPTQLIRAGWGRKRSQAALAPGTAVTLTLAPSHDQAHVALVEKILNAAGELVLGTALSLTK